MAYEMGLNKWYIISQNAEEKKTRTNLKKLGCLFESFLGALFLDFNKITIKDEDDWFKNVFVTGPGFQIAQIFVENIFEKHVNWMELIQNDDNYKNILQVKIQKEFKVTPHYMDIEEYDADNGYHMGVFLCLGQPIHSVSLSQAIDISKFGSYQEIHQVGDFTNYYKGNRSYFDPILWYNNEQKKYEEADEEEKFTIAQANSVLNKDGSSCAGDNSNCREISNGDVLNLPE